MAKGFDDGDDFWLFGFGHGADVAHSERTAYLAIVRTFLSQAFEDLFGQLLAAFR